jgi:hypothetical protein
MMKRREFAHFLHISPFNYGFIEKGYTKPTKKQAKKISDATGEDFAPYLEGDYSYPAPLPPKPEGKLIKGFYELCGKLWVRLVIIFFLLASIATLSVGLYYGDQYNKHSIDYYTEEYQSFSYAVREKGTATISLTSDLTRPEIFIKDDTKFYSIKGSYDDSDISLLSAVATYHTDANRVSYTISFGQSLYINVYYVDYSSGNSFQLTYLETSKDNYEQKTFFDISSVLDTTTDEGKAAKEAIETLVKSHLPELNSTFDLLISEKAGLNYSFYDGLAVDHYQGSKRLNTLSILSLFLIVMGTVLIAANIFFLAFCYIYGRKKDESPFYKMEISRDVLSREPHAKKDFFFGPFIPETVYEIVGIFFVFFGSLRILYYFFTFIGAITISGNDFSLIPETFFYLFMIGMFLLYFIDFDIFLDDKRVFRNIVLYFLIFLVLYVFESLIMTYISNSNILLLKELGSNLSIPNNFGTVTCYFLMMMTLFYTPKGIKTHKGEVCYRLLTIIPVLIIITNTLIYHYANTKWGWNLSIPVLYLFSSERTQFSLLCIIYLLGLYFLKLYYEKKYGKEKGLALMGGNRFLLLKNSIAALTVLIIGILEISLKNNNAAHELGLGKYPNIIWLAPALLFYHPHKGERSAGTDWATLIFYFLSFAGGYILIALPFIIILFASI